MIRLSVNVISSVILLLDRLANYHFSSLAELAYTKLTSINVEDLFEFSQNCGWVSESENALIITSRGKGLLDLYNQELHNDLQRTMLMDYVLTVSPIWSNRIPFGRHEAAIFMTKDERACFSEAGLLSEQIDRSIVEWWDTVANKLRAKTQQVQSDKGRIGEKNTIQFERERTNSEPKWMSVDSNLAGYDIQSRVSSDNHSTLLIEVKTSTSPLEQAFFHVTSHEWGVAQTSIAYVFHLWCIFGGKRLLAIISPENILPYIPTNNLSGEWESAKIPFSSFKSNFVEIA